MRAWTVCAVALVAAGCTQSEEPASSYAPLLQSPIRGLSAEEIEAIRTGAGMRLALPAELNGYPGPKHILEHADALQLTPTQRQAVEALYEATMQEARREGHALLQRYQALDESFRNQTLDEESLRQAVQALDAQHAAVRYVHLRAHLEAKSLLSGHQLAQYAQLRGYAAHDHAHTF